MRAAVQVSFERPSYTVEEDDGTAEVCITTSTGHPDRAITVTIQPLEGTNANCGDALEAIGGKLNYFAAMITYQSRLIPSQMALTTMDHLSPQLSLHLLRVEGSV